MIGRALVVDPADLDVVALVGAPEAELHIRILGDGRSPVGDENFPVAVLESQLLDEVRRNHRTLRVLDKAGIHRVLDQCLHLGEVAAGNRAHADG